MQIVRGHLHHWDRTLTSLLLPVDRLTLAKRRWRGVASDGTEFGFDLEEPLADGDIFFQGNTVFYQLAQNPEPVLEVAVSSSLEAAWMGWQIGNLHFQIAPTGTTILAPDDPAIRQMLERERVSFREICAVFRPLGHGHSHGHHSH